MLSIEELETRNLPSNIFIVTTTSDFLPPSDVLRQGGGLSLRQAILLANKADGPAVIDFQIPSNGSGQIFSITPRTPLPVLTNAILIDGTSQQAFNGGTVELDGAALLDGGNGLTIDASHCAIQGLVINHFQFGAGIALGFDATSCIIQGNEIGTAAAGIRINGFDNTIGGAAPTAGNVIASNRGAGIQISGEGATGNLVEGNFIGTDRSATLSLPNGGDGVQVNGSNGNAILDNAIFLNSGLGIHLVNGGNDGQPAPQLGPVVIAGGTMQVAWSLNSPKSPLTPFRIEFFNSSVIDPNGPGPGQHFLTTVLATTDATGHAAGTLVLSNITPAEPFLTATATDLQSRDTSQFSPSDPLPLVDLAISESVDNLAPVVGQTVIFTVTVTNSGGPITATGVSVANLLPTGLTFLAAQSSQGSYDGRSGTWSIGTLPAGTEATLTIQALVQPGTAYLTLKDTSLVTTANQLDSSSANDRASASVRPVPVIASLTQVPPFVQGPIVSASRPVFLPTLPETMPHAPEIIAAPEGILSPSALVAVLMSDSVTLTAPAAPVNIQFLSTEQGAIGLPFLFARAEPPPRILDPLIERPANKDEETGSITGTVFLDINADGIWQADEPALEGMTLYLDRIDSGTFDANKPLAITNCNGQFRFDGLAPGEYVVRTVPDRRYVVTAPEVGLIRVQVEAGEKVSITFGCKRIRRQPTGDDDARRHEERWFQARDALFISGGAFEEGSEIACYLSGVLLVSSAASLSSWPEVERAWRCSPAGCAAAAAAEAERPAPPSDAGPCKRHRT